MWSIIGKKRTVTLFHFSDDPEIEVFLPRPVRVPSQRPEGLEWLNGPLVWAINDAYQTLYLFPRDCPRIVLWPTERSAKDDIEAYWGHSSARFLAYIERDWLARLWNSKLYRYAVPSEGFEDFGERGTYVCRTEVTPLRRDTLQDLPYALAEQGAELRIVDDLSALRPAWESSLHASGIRLRNAATWKA